MSILSTGLKPGANQTTFEAKHLCALWKEVICSSWLIDPSHKVGFSLGLVSYCALSSLDNPTGTPLKKSILDFTVSLTHWPTGVQGLNASYIIVRLPDGLPTGNLPLTVTLHGVVSSNTPTLEISP